MSQNFICNTFFEMELEAHSDRSLLSWLRSSAIFMQLQFLPLLYAGPNDRILVSNLPENPDPRLLLIDDSPPPFPINHWGPSLAIHAWAKKHKLPYEIPNWKLIQTINSKVFSFTESPKLPGAKLIHSQEEAIGWLQSFSGPKVFKSALGTAGRGHQILKTDHIKKLHKMPLIAEPWVERVLDFSTQWLHGKLIGVTLFESGVNGAYKGTYVGDVEPWALQEHLDVAEPLVTKIVNMGYSDHLGIDAFIYLWNGKKKCHPIVEINGRKTMSWVALQTPQKQIKNRQCLHLEKILSPLL